MRLLRGKQECKTKIFGRKIRNASAGGTDKKVFIFFILKFRATVTITHFIAYNYLNFCVVPYPFSKCGNG